MTIIPNLIQPDTHEMVTELCDHTKHRERIERRQGTTIIIDIHVTEHPSLLAQLANSIEPSGATEGGLRPGFGSKPSARLDAIDAYLRIDHEAARWVRHLGEDDPGDTTTCVRRAHALGRHNKAVQHAIRRWWVTARVVTGWDTPAWQPDATCPLCARRGTLRIRLATQTGLCLPDTGCGETWTPDTIGLLADHIRDETETRANRHPTTPPNDTFTHATDAERARVRSAGEVSPDTIPAIVRGLTV